MKGRDVMVVVMRQAMDDREACSECKGGGCYDCGDTGLAQYQISTGAWEKKERPEEPKESSEQYLQLRHSQPKPG